MFSCSNVTYLCNCCIGPTGVYLHAIHNFQPYFIYINQIINDKFQIPIILKLKRFFILY